MAHRYPDRRFRSAAAQYEFPNAVLNFTITLREKEKKRYEDSDQQQKMRAVKVQPRPSYLHILFSKEVRKGVWIRAILCVGYGS